MKMNKEQSSKVEQEPVAYWIPKADQFCKADATGRPFDHLGLTFFVLYQSASLLTPDSLKKALGSPVIALNATTPALVLLSASKLL